MVERHAALGGEVVEGLEFRFREQKSTRGVAAAGGAGFGLTRQQAALVAMPENVGEHGLHVLVL